MLVCLPSTSDTSASRAGFLEADDPPVEPWSFKGGMEDASARRLEDTSDVPFTQNKTNTMCGRWSSGDRVFGTKEAIDLSQCYAECSKRQRCNYFSIAFDGPMAGRCQGCEKGVTEDRADFVFFTIKRSDQTTSFSCDDGSVTSVDLDTLVDGHRPYELCITKEGGDEPTCYDMRNEGQAKKRKPKNPNFLVRISSGGAGVFHVKGWGPTSSVCPLKPRKAKLLSGYLGILP